MKYFLIGIKGSGMASLAQILLDLNHEVSGSDIEAHIFTQDALEKRGIEIFPFNEANIQPGMTIIKGNSFNEEHPEVKKAKELNLTIITYLEMVSDLMKQHYGISIAGTHGKTTTTGLVTKLLEGKEATGYLIGDGHGMFGTDSQNFVVESCEYQDNYLAFHPEIALINNIELDHVDYFKSMEQYINSFNSFALQAKKYAVLNGDDKNIKVIEKKDNYYYFGLSDDCNIQAKNIVFDEDGMSFDLYSDINKIHKKEFCYHFQLNLYGKHMLYNVLAAIGIYLLKDIDQDYSYLEKQLNNFSGVARRFEEKVVGSNVFIDDYAHHPTAIKLMIETVRQKYPEHKVIAFFKPDRYSRIYEFGHQIALALDQADEAYLFNFPTTSAKEAGIDIDISYVKNFMKKGIIINEELNDALRFKGYTNSIFLMMSSKNVYDFAKLLITNV